MKQFFISILFLSFIPIIQAQTGGRGAGGRGAQANIGRFYGKIVDAATNKGIDAASVQLLQSRMDTVTKKRRDTLLTGMLTSKNGDFSLENLPMFGNFRLEITAIGYKPLTQKVGFELKFDKMSDLEENTLKYLLLYGEKLL